VYPVPQFPEHAFVVRSHAFSVSQSVATLHPHTPLTQAVPLPVQGLQIAPAVPHAPDVVLETSRQVPPLQQAPLHGVSLVQAVVQAPLPLHA
jgi:hypothetical protein